MKYALTIEKDGEGFLARFPDVPEALTGGDTLEETLSNAADALITAFEFYFEDGRTIPFPEATSQHYIDVAPSTWAKVLLLNAMLDSNLTQSGLAKLIGSTRQEMQRVFDLNHATKIDTIDAALRAMGKKLDLKLSPV